jgi:hypothetical protein
MGMKSVNVLVISRFPDDCGLKERQTGYRRVECIQGGKYGSSASADSASLSLSYKISLVPISERLASPVHEFAIADAPARSRPQCGLSPIPHSLKEPLWSFHTLRTSVALVHSEETLTIPTLQATNKCSSFEENPALPAAPDRFQSSVVLSVFREFLSELEGKAVKIPHTNLTGLQRFCEEFGFDEFAAKLSQFLQ